MTYHRTINKFCILIWISFQWWLLVVHLTIKPSLVRIMAWRRTGDNPLPWDYYSSLGITGANDDLDEKATGAYWFLSLRPYLTNKCPTTVFTSKLVVMTKTWRILCVTWHDLDPTKPSVYRLVPLGGIIYTFNRCSLSSPASITSGPAEGLPHGDRCHGYASRCSDAWLFR